MLAMFHGVLQMKIQIPILILKISVNGVICKVTLSSPCLWASFHPLSPLSVVSARHFISS
jgi:hypothetical protein